MQSSTSDSSYFDSDFTMEKVQLTPTDQNLLSTVDQLVFSGFSYTNPVSCTAPAAAAAAAVPAGGGISDK